LLGRLVARIAIRVPLESQLPVRDLDLDVARTAINAQRLIVIGRQGPSPPTTDSRTARPTTPKPSPAAAAAPRRGNPSAARPPPSPPESPGARRARSPRGRAGRTAVRPHRKD